MHSFIQPRVYLRPKGVNRSISGTCISALHAQYAGKGFSVKAEAGLYALSARQEVTYWSGAESGFHREVSVSKLAKI